MSATPEGRPGAGPLRRRADVEATILFDGYVALHVLGIGQVYTLTPLGGLIWELCEGRSVEEIVGPLGEAAGLPADAALRAQVAEFVAELERAGLLVPASTPENSIPSPPPVG
jgi:hypothetical protein